MQDIRTLSSLISSALILTIVSIGDVVRRPIAIARTPSSFVPGIVVLKAVVIGLLTVIHAAESPLL